MDKCGEKSPCYPPDRGLNSGWHYLPPPQPGLGQQGWAHTDIKYLIVAKLRSDC